MAKAIARQPNNSALAGTVDENEVIEFPVLGLIIAQGTDGRIAVSPTRPIDSPEAFAVWKEETEDYLRTADDVSEPDGAKFYIAYVSLELDNTKPNDPREMIRTLIDSLNKAF